MSQQWPPNQGQGGPWQPYQGDPYQSGYPQGGYPQGEYPQYGQPQQQYGHPQQPADPNQAYYQNPYYQNPYYQQQAYYQQDTPPPAKKNRGLLIGIAVALVVLLGGGATWFAVSAGGSGASSPTAAAKKLATALNNNDVIGMLSMLPPAEATLFTTPAKEVVSELKRLGVIKPDVQANELTGGSVTVKNVKFDKSATEHVNDHLAITKLVDGTLILHADPSKLPFTEQFFDSAIPGGGMPAIQRSGTLKIDIGKQLGDEAIRIATVRVDGSWYPSALYTIADYALQASGEQWPTRSIPAKGANSPKQAIKMFTQAIMDRDLRKAISLLPPDALRVVHDVGPVLLQAATEEGPTGYKIVSLQTSTSEVSGGTRATITAVKVRDPLGRTLSVSKDGDCYKLSTPSMSKRFCAQELTRQILDGADVPMSSKARSVVSHLANGVLSQGVGIITTEVDGAYYVSPIHTLTEQFLTILRSMRPGDFQKLIDLAD